MGSKHSRAVTLLHSSMPLQCLVRGEHFELSNVAGPSLTCFTACALSTLAQNHLRLAADVPNYCQVDVDVHCNITLIIGSFKAQFFGVSSVTQEQSTSC
jgi:hypothetical protein